MVKIPAGTFLMGMPVTRGNPDEKPMHEAIVAGFYLDEAEVRFDAYGRCVKAGKCEPPRPKGRFCNAKFEGRDDHPANCVDLTQAAAYCAWRGARLPTEREWEYAASGGKKRRRYSWGDDEPSDEISCYNHPGGSCPVKSFEPGAFGLYDMTGNVWEWTQSRFEPYPTRFKPDPIEPDYHYAYRGGSWSRRYPKWMRNQLRNRYKPDNWSAAVGIRCAKSTTPLECPPETGETDGECVRTGGEVMCEPGYAFKDGACRTDVSQQAAMHRSAMAREAALGKRDGGAAPAHNPDAPITKTRTPSVDADCAKFWPGKPKGYMFKGGRDYNHRKPVLTANGCTARNMSWGWTSACCAQ
jgi:hypothetical protein